MVLPVPGGPASNRLWPPATAISIAWRAALLPQIRRREVDRHLLERHVMADRLERRSDPHRAFLHGRRGEPDHVVRRQLAGADRAFDVDRDGIDPHERA